METTENYAVIADNGGSDQKYRDVVGEIYTFPSMYANILTEGTKFVYQRCSVGSMRVAEPDNERLLKESHYFGTAEIGPVTYIGEGLYEAEIINYKRFIHGVPFKLSDGSHFEVLPGYFWRNGVRYSQVEVYEEISKAGFGEIPSTSPLVDVKPIEHPRIKIKTDNDRKVAKNRSSVQVKDNITGGIGSETFLNDTLQIVTDKDGYWLYSVVMNKYFRLAHLSGIKCDKGRILLSRGLLSKEPRIMDDSKFMISHSTDSIKITIGTLKITEDSIEFQGTGTSQKTMDLVKISLSLVV